MPKVKLFWVMDSFENESVIASGADSTDWEDITDEELQFLKTYRWNLPRTDSMYLTIVVQNEKSVFEYIKSIKNWITEQQSKQAEEERLRKEKAEERKRKKAMSAEEKEREQFEKLKAKFEGKQ